MRQCGADANAATRQTARSGALADQLPGICVGAKRGDSRHSSRCDAGPVSTEVHEELDRELARQDDPASIEKALRFGSAPSASAQSTFESKRGRRPCVGRVGHRRMADEGTVHRAIDFYEGTANGRSPVAGDYRKSLPREAPCRRRRGTASWLICCCPLSTRRFGRSSRYRDDPIVADLQRAATVR